MDKNKMYIAIFSALTFNFAKNMFWGFSSKIWWLINLFMFTTNLYFLLKYIDKERRK